MALIHEAFSIQFLFIKETLLSFFCFNSDSFFLVDVTLM